jgi:hypothetical protein
MNIVIEEDNTGAAPKCCRYAAYDQDAYDGAEDSRRRSSIGYGETRREAIADLLEIMEAEGEIDADAAAYALNAFDRYLDPDRLREDRDERRSLL